MYVIVLFQIKNCFASKDNLDSPLKKFSGKKRDTITQETLHFNVRNVGLKQTEKMNWKVKRMVLTT